MKQLSIIMLTAILIAGCGEKRAENVVWREDFRVEHLPWKTVLGNSDWQIEQGVWIVKGTAPFEQLVIAEKDWSGEECEINAAVRLGEKGEAGVVLGYKDEKDFWRITLDHSQNHIALINRAHGSDSIIADGSISLSHREFHNLVVDAGKAQLIVKCDNLIVFQCERPAGLDGRMGIYAGISSPPGMPIFVNFDSYEVKPIR